MMYEQTSSCVEEFYYQKYWTRVLCLVLVVFFLPTLEKGFLGLINVYWGMGIFFIVSTTITFITAFLLFKPLGKFFVKTGYIEFLKDIIVIHTNNKKQISIKEITDCKLEKKYLYGTYFALLRVEYVMDKREQEYIIISEDINMRELEDSSLWSVYCGIKERME